MSRYTVIEQENGAYGVEDNNAPQDSPTRILDVTFRSQGEAAAHAGRLNRTQEEEKA